MINLRTGFDNAGFPELPATRIVNMPETSIEKHMVRDKTVTSLELLLRLDAVRKNLDLGALYLKQQKNIYSREKNQEWILAFRQMYAKQGIDKLLGVLSNAILELDSISMEI